MSWNAWHLGMRIVNRFLLVSFLVLSQMILWKQKHFTIPLSIFTVLRHHWKQTYPTRKFAMKSHTKAAAEQRWAELLRVMHCGEMSAQQKQSKSGCISQRRTTPQGSSPVIPVRGICTPKVVIQLICPSIWPHNTALYSSNAVCLTHLAAPVWALAQQVKLNNWLTSCDNDKN